MMRNALILATLLVTSAAAAADVEHSFQSVVARGAVKRVVIDIPSGSFTIRNGDATKLSLAAIVSRDYDGEKERVWAQKVVNDTSIEFYVSGSEAIVRRKFGKNAQTFRAQKFSGIDLRLDLPPGVDVEFETTAGEVDLSGNFGDVDIDLRAGEIDLVMPRALVRELSASCRLGEVRADLGTEVITKEGVFPGRTKFFNASGKSNVYVHTTAGEVRIRLTQ